MEFTNLVTHASSYDSMSDHGIGIFDGSARPILQEQDLLRCFEENSNNNSNLSMDCALNLGSSSDTWPQIVEMHQLPQFNGMIIDIPKVMESYGMMHGDRNLLYNRWGNAGSSYNTWSPYAPSHTSNLIHGHNIFGGSLMAAAPGRCDTYSGNVEFSGISNQKNSFTLVTRGSEAQGRGRTCEGCGTAQTPMWRNGPAGPKSLCNACGLKYTRRLRKASGNSESGTKRKRGE